VKKVPVKQIVGSMTLSSDGITFSRYLLLASIPSIISAYIPFMQTIVYFVPTFSN
jgi:hypothetical protein